jgi:hypothetical protein
MLAVGCWLLDVGALISYLRTCQSSVLYSPIPPLPRPPNLALALPLFPNGDADISYLVSAHRIQSDWSGLVIGFQMFPCGAMVICNLSEIRLELKLAYPIIHVLSVYSCVVGP